MYSLDTSFFMDWQARHYPLDLFVGLEHRIEGLIDQGECRAVDLVREELQAVGTPDLRTWTTKNKRVFVSLSADVQLAAAAIQSAYPALMDPKGLHDSADAYVIALAKSTGGIVVSQETSVAEKHRPKQSYYIPDVCRSLGVSCINLLGMMRREKWSF
ncbi:MAG: DUF4411 family protein [Gemmatimonadales bacterium]